MDAQDAQDNQDQRLLHETLTPAMIACGFADVQEYKPAVSGKNPVHPVHPCESKIYPCLTLSRLPALHDGADHTKKKLRIILEDEPRMDTNRDGTPSMTNRARMHLRYCDLDITKSWEEAHPGARASRPHNTGKASPISSTRIDRQRRPGSASAEPMRFPPAGWSGAPSQGNRAATQGTGLIGPEAAARDADWESGRWAQPRPATGKINREGQ